MRKVVFYVQLSFASTICPPVAAQSIDGRFNVGIDVPLLDTRHVTQDISIPGAVQGETTTASLGQTTTQMGLFTNGAGLDAKYGLSDQAILGGRLALRRGTSASDGNSTATYSQVSLLPRFEYYMAPDTEVRPHIGIEGGYERSTSNASTGATSSSWLIGATGGVSYFASSSWSVDLNGSLYFVTGSQEFQGQSASTSGYGGVLRISVSSWFGSSQSATPATTQLSAQPPAQLPRPEQSPTDARSEMVHLGIVQQAISITPELTLTLTTRPITNPDIVNFQLTMTGTAGAFSGCESFAIDFDGNRIRGSHTHRRSKAGGFTAEESLVGTLPIDVLEAASLHKGGSAIIACEQRWAMKSTHIGHMAELKTTTDMIARGEGLVAGDSSALEVHEESIATELLLSRDSSLKLEAKPLVNPYLVSVQFIVRGKADSIATCSSVDLFADGKELRIDDARATRQATDEGTAQSIEGNLTLIAVAHITAGSDQEKVTACDKTAIISSFNREQTWAFLAQSVALAKRLGAWRGYRAPSAQETLPGTAPKAPQADSVKRK